MRDEDLKDLEWEVRIHQAEKERVHRTSGNIKIGLVVSSLMLIGCIFNPEEMRPFMVTALIGLTASIFFWIDNREKKQKLAERQEVLGGVVESHGFNSGLVLPPSGSSIWATQDEMSELAEKVYGDTEANGK